MQDDHRASVNTQGDVQQLQPFKNKAFFIVANKAHAKQICGVVQKKPVAVIAVQHNMIGSGH